MDALSALSASMHLAQTASKTVIWICDVVKNIRNVDNTVGDLIKETKQLEALLSSMHKTMIKCQSTVALTLPHIDEQTWAQIDVMFSDCRNALQDLNNFFRRITKSNDLEAAHLEPPSTYMTRSAKYIRFEWHSSEISTTRDKIQKSIRAVELMLKVLHLSLTMRSDDRLDTISQGLASLYTLVEQTLSKESDIESIEATATQGANLKQLAIHARRFHSAASSTASTMYGGAANRSSRASFANWGGSEFGDLSDARRQDIKNWNIQIIEEAVEETVNTPTTTLHESQHSGFSENLPLKPMSVDGFTYGGGYLGGSSKPIDGLSAQPNNSVRRTTNALSWTIIIFSTICRLAELGLAALMVFILGYTLSHREAITAQYPSILYGIVVAAISIVMSLLGVVPRVRLTLRWPVDFLVCMSWIVMLALFATIGTCQ